MSHKTFWINLVAWRLAPFIVADEKVRQIHVGSIDGQCVFCGGKGSGTLRDVVSELRLSMVRTGTRDFLGWEWECQNCKGVLWVPQSLVKRDSPWPESLKEALESMVQDADPFNTHAGSDERRVRGLVTAISHLDYLGKRRIENSSLETRSACAVGVFFFSAFASAILLSDASTRSWGWGALTITLSSLVVAGWIATVGRRRWIRRSLAPYLACIALRWDPVPEDAFNAVQDLVKKRSWLAKYIGVKDLVMPADVSVSTSRHD